MYKCNKYNKNKDKNVLPKIFSENCIIAVFKKMPPDLNLNLHPDS